MTLAETAAEPEEARSIVVERLIAAPRELVFRAFTTAEHLAHWWGPTGFSITTSAFEFRPGGVWRFVMHGPDGRDYQNRQVFDVIEPPARIVCHYGDGEDVERAGHQTLHHARGRRRQDPADLAVGVRQQRGTRPPR